MIKRQTFKLLVSFKKHGYAIYIQNTLETNFCLVSFFIKGEYLVKCEFLVNHRQAFYVHFSFLQLGNKAEM